MLETKCLFIECKETDNLNKNGYCLFHSNGGNFGTGETYEQYQIIENDFINYIKYVPLNEPNHLKVYSPILRDIILRSCVQIELFLKEWALFYCSEYKTYPPFANKKIWKEYNKCDKEGIIAGTKSWKIGTYHFLKQKFYPEENPIFVRPLNEYINPFDDWKDEKNPPSWWKAYNLIKHGGQSAKSSSNLKNALLSLSALFYLHCVNDYSKQYLEKFSSFHINSRFGKIELEYDPITSPINNKKYLFRFESSYPNRKIELANKIDSVHRSI
jgi:hypothetical protein